MTHDLCRYTCNNNAVWDVLGDYSSRSNYSPVSDCYSWQYYAARTQPRIIPDEHRTRFECKRRRLPVMLPSPYLDLSGNIDVSTNRYASTGVEDRSVSYTGLLADS